MRKIAHNKELVKLLSVLCSKCHNLKKFYMSFFEIFSNVLLVQDDELCFNKDIHTIKINIINDSYQDFRAFQSEELKTFKFKMKKTKINIFYLKFVNKRILFNTCHVHELLR